MAVSGDDADGSTEEDYLAWQTEMWVEFAKVMNLQNVEVAQEPAFSFAERKELDSISRSVYLGDYSRESLLGHKISSCSASNPYLASITESRELFSCVQRNCLHMEINIGVSGMTYTTGKTLEFYHQFAQGSC
jgi:NADPH-ferrihemoprotein reductase